MIRIIVCRSEVDLADIKKKFQAKYGQSLKQVTLSVREEVNHGGRRWYWVFKKELSFDIFNIIKTTQNGYFFVVDVTDKVKILKTFG